MIRFNIILAGLLVVASTAAGRPISIPKPPSSHAGSGHALLDLAHLHLFQLFHKADESNATVAESSSNHSDDWSRQSQLPDLSMGPLHPKFGEDDNPLSSLSTAEMPDQLGSSVWKEQENKSHSAKLLFVWPTDK